MPDISKCANNDCPLKSKCYRFRVLPDEYQSYADFKPVNGTCDSFWDVKGYPKERLLPENYVPVNLFENNEGA